MGEGRALAVRAWATGQSRIFAVLGLQVAVVVVFALAYDAYDFHVYALGGHAVLQGDELYAFRWGHHGFTYPPFAAVGFLPLAHLPLAAARVVWDAASLAALAVAVRATYVLAGRRPAAQDLTVAVAGCLLLEPVWHTLFLGQINLVLLAAVLVDVQRIAAGRIGGVGIGLAAAVKLTPAIFILLLLLARRRRSAAVAATTALAATATGAIAAPYASWQYWTGYVTDVSRVGRLTYASNQSISALVARAFGHREEAVAVLVLLVAGAGLLAAGTLARWGDWLAAAALTGVTGLLISPISWSHHWVWAIPALAVLVRDGRRRAAAAGGALLVLAPIWWPVVDVHGFRGLPTVERNSYALAGLAFVGHEVIRARRFVRASRILRRRTVLAP